VTVTNELDRGQVEEREGQPVHWLNAGQQPRRRGERGDSPADKSGPSGERHRVAWTNPLHQSWPD
jgi:hypothetical protein